MTEWIDIEKEQPPLGEQILIYRRLYPIHMGYMVEREKHSYLVIANTFITFPATHWMPLPEPPIEAL